MLLFITNIPLEANKSAFKISRVGSILKRSQASYARNHSFKYASHSQHPTRCAQHQHSCQELTDWQNSHFRFHPKAHCATPAHREEILRRDGDYYQTPGCPNKVWLEIHYLILFSKGGKTLPKY